MPVEKLTILLDMDGVMFDFSRAAVEAHGLSVRGWRKFCEEYTANPSPDMLLEFLSLSHEEMAENIGSKDFWANVPLYPSSHGLLYHLELLGDVVFCTSPINTSTCIDGKRASVAKHFGAEKAKNMIFEKCKYKLANDRTLLIDDFDSQVQDFQASGGLAALLPQPWNQGRKEFYSRLGGVVTSHSNTVNRLRKLQKARDEYTCLLNALKTVNLGA